KIQRLDVSPDAAGGVVRLQEVLQGHSRQHLLAINTAQPRGRANALGGPRCPQRWCLLRRHPERGRAFTGANLLVGVHGLLPPFRSPSPLSLILGFFYSLSGKAPTPKPQ